MQNRSTIYFLLIIIFNFYFIKCSLKNITQSFEKKQKDKNPKDLKKILDSKISSVSKNEYFGKKIEKIYEEKKTPDTSDVIDSPSKLEFSLYNPQTKKQKNNAEIRSEDLKEKKFNEESIIETFNLVLEKPVSDFGIDYFNSDKNKKKLIHDFIKSPKIQENFKNMDEDSKKSLFNKLLKSRDNKISNLNKGDWVNSNLKKNFEENKKNDTFKKKDSNQKNNFYDDKNEIASALNEEEKFHKADSLRDESKNKNDEDFNKYTRGFMVKRNTNFSKEKKPNNTKERYKIIKDKLSQQEQKDLKEKLNQSFNNVLLEFEKKIETKTMPTASAA